MSWLFLHLNGNPFGSAVLAGLFLLAVMFGVHQGFVPVYFALVDAQGFNSLFPILAMAGAGQVDFGENYVQEALRKAWEKRHTLREERYLQTWVVRILINECRMLCRRSARMVPVEEVHAASGDEALLREALFSLEEKLRTPILLHYIEGYSVEETARALRMPQGTVKSRMARGRAKLREMLQEEVFEA